ncbi:MAG: zinc-binding dehydrogenase, partial [Patescibacteria group bacterium]
DQVAKSAGGTVFGFDRHDGRLQYAQNHQYVYKGINTNGEKFIERLRETDGYNGADVTFEAVGSESSAELALELTRAGGKVVILGVFEHDVHINMMQIVKKELQVQGSWTCIFSFDQTLLLLKTKKIDITGLITHRYPFSDAMKAFDEATNDKANRIKSVIEFE